MSHKKHIILIIAVLFFLSALIMLRQLISSAYFSCIIQDSFDYTSWAGQFIQALKEGIIYPRWLPLNFWGYGSPAFILYPPLAFYLVSFFDIFTHSVITAMNITKFVALFLSGVGMFFLIKEFYSEKIALLTAAFYVIFPYNIFQFYFVGTFASTVSYMWFSPIVLFTYRYIKHGSYINIAYAGLCYGGLILTHLINAYMFTFVLLSFVIFMSITRKRPENLFAIPIILVIGFLISAAYILPVLHDKRFFNLGFFIKDFVLDFHNFFIIPDMTTKFAEGHAWRAYYNVFVSYAFFFSVFIVVSLIQTMKLRRVKEMESIYRINKFFTGIAIFSIFLMFGISTVIWETVPFFKYIQFPNRWLNVAAFAVVFLSAIMFWTVVTVYKTKQSRGIFITLLFLMCLLLDFKYVVSSCVFKKEKFETHQASNWNYEHLPIWVNIEKISKNIKQEKLLISEGEGRTKTMKWNSAERVIEITAQTPLTLRVRTFNFPGWNAYIDTVRTEIRTEEGTGAMLVAIPEGNHTLLMKFEDTPIGYYSKIISSVSFFIMVILVLIPKKTNRTSITGI